MGDERWLAGLADSVSDGREVDWPKAESEARDDGERELVRALRAISEIASAHRSWQGSGEGTSSPGTGEIPQTWGHLEILEKVGEGSFGEVYRARDPQLDRVVALKLLRGGAAASVEEGKLLARVRHPNVATVYGADLREGRVGLWMEFLEGRTLSELLREQGTFGAREATLIVADLCRALAAVHARGILHRDIKAQNVMRETGGRIVLMDFGIGRDLQGETPPEDSLSGTPLYLAPEVLAGRPSSVQSDIYALGVLLYHLTTGSFPVQGGSLDDLRRAHDRGEVKLLRDVRPDLPEPFLRVVERALAPDPGRRYATVGAMEQAFQEVLDAGAAPRSRVRAWIAAAGLALAVVALALWSPGRKEARDELRPTSLPEKVLVGDFENRTGVAVFDSTVRHLVTLALEQSPRLQVFPRERIAEALARMRRPEGTRLSGDVAREICLREDIDTLISGEILPGSPGYTVILKAVEARNGKRRFLGTVAVASQAELIPAIDRATAELRNALGEPRAAIDQSHRPLAHVTTSSLEALSRFSQALDLHAQGDLELAIESLEMAVDLDPEFAMAYGRLAMYQSGLGLLEESLASAERAYQLRDKVSERERYQIAAMYHLDRLQYEEALKDFQKAILLDPEDANSHRHLAMLHANLGDAGPGIPSAQRAAELLPDNVIARGNLPVLLAAANRPDEALAEVEKARARLGDDPYFYWGEGLAWLVKGDSPRAEAAFRSLMKGDPTYQSHGRLLLAQTLVYEGRLREAAAELEAGLALDLRMGFQRNAATRSCFLSETLDLLGERNEALRRLQSLENLKDLPINLKNLRNAAVLFSELGDLRTAASLSQRIERLRDRYPSSLGRGEAAQIQGEIARAWGDAEEARLRFEEAVLYWRDPSTLRSAARFWAESGRCDKAVPLLEEMLAQRGRVLRDFFAATWVVGHLDLARCAARLGEPEKAREHYDQFLRLWGGAEDLAIVSAARKERDALPKERQR